MMPEIKRPFENAFELTSGLRRLGEARAPESLLPAVLTSIGLSDSYTRFGSPIGPFFVAFNQAGVSAVMRAADERDFEHAFRDRFGRRAYRAATMPRELARALEPGAPREARRKLQFDLHGLSELQRAVLLKTLEIPPGEVRPYAWVAREIGRPRAVRAVGSALAGNPIPLLIPCHRVVRSDGSIGEYGLGNDSKRVMLAAEGVEVEALESMARSAIRYWGSDSTRIFCFPTCRHARRSTEHHRVTFASVAEAAGAGYRPCKVCRPA